MVYILSRSNEGIFENPQKESKENAKRRKIKIRQIQVRQRLEKSLTDLIVSGRQMDLGQNSNMFKNLITLRSVFELDPWFWLADCIARFFKSHKKYAICELGVAFSQFKELPIWDHVFAPKEFFHEVLEKQFAKVIVKFIKVDATNQMIEKPTITLNRVSWSLELREIFMVFR